MNRQLLFWSALVAAFAMSQTSSAAIILKADVNDRTEGEPVSPPGFSSFVLPPNPPSPGVLSAATVIVNGYTCNLSVFDSNGATGGVGAMDDRDRPVPTTAPNYNEIYDDFFFVGNSAGPTGGLDLRISGPALLPNTVYRFSLYAYDGISASMATATPVRSADWFDGNNADALVFNATFTVNVPPVTDTQYRFTGLARTDGAGQLFLKGRRVTAADLAVYVDGFEIRNVPEPGSVLLFACGGIALTGVLRRRAR